MKVDESQEMGLRVRVLHTPYRRDHGRSLSSRRIKISERATCMSQIRPMIKASKNENSEMKSVERIVAHMSHSMDTFLV